MRGESEGRQDGMGRKEVQGEEGEGRGGGRGGLEEAAVSAPCLFDDRELLQLKSRDVGGIEDKDDM
eukprot:689049-Hanusia_phi.AAC.1